MTDRYLPTALRRALEKTVKDARLIAESPSVARPATDARRPGAKSSQGGGLKLRSRYALPPFQATAARLTLIDAPVSSCSSRRSRTTTWNGRYVSPWKYVVV